MAIERYDRPGVSVIITRRPSQVVVRVVWAGRRCEAHVSERLHPGVTLLPTPVLADYLIDRCARYRRNVVAGEAILAALTGGDP